MAAPLCTKCKTTEHRLHQCTKAWLFWTDQVCDRCGSPDHEASDCKIKPPLNSSCKICGHQGHHNTGLCPISDNKNDLFLRQYTKAKYEAVMASRQIAAAKNAAKTTPGSSTPSGPRQHGAMPMRPQGGSSAFSNSGPPQASGSRIAPPGSGRNTKSARPQFKRVNRTLPEPDAEHKEKKEWAKHNLELADFSSVEVADSEKNTVKTITTNFFRVKIERDVKIHKYRIVLGEVNGSKVTKREMKRAMIYEILTGEPPNASIWVTDYVSHVISVGKLYNRFVDEVGEAWSITHQRPLPGGRDFASVDSTIFYEGMLKVGKVNDFVNPLVARDPNYLPDEDFRILNLLSWKHIYDVRQPAGSTFTIGKKFYPDNQENSAGQLNNVNKETLCDIKRGFFSSMRPGDGSLLLNVNTTTSAFFPKMNLQTWIDRRSRESILQHRIWKELKNLRVSFRGDTIFKPRAILRIGETVSNQTFTFNNGSRTVFHHMKLQYPHIGPFNSDAWCVSVGIIPNTNNNIWFPADKLTIIPNQPFHGQMTGDMTTQMLLFTAKEPNFNQQMIMDYARTFLGITPLPGSNQKFYSGFGITVEDKFLTVGSRKLVAPEINFLDTLANKGKTGDKTKFDEVSLNIYRASKYNEYRKDPAAWQELQIRLKKPNKLPPRDTASWDLKFVSMVIGRTFQEVAKTPANLHIINVCNTGTNKEINTKKNKVLRFGNELIKCLRDYGIQLESPCKIENVQTIRNRLHLETRRAEFCFNLDRAWNILCPSTNPNTATTPPKLVVVALANKDAGVYADVRWWADCKLGISCICVTPDAVKKVDTAFPDKALLGNLALKYNFRLGGRNHVISGPLGFKKLTMVVGADVTHPGRTLDELCTSMAGVVATHDDYAIQYLASARLQPKNTEHIADLEGMMTERLAEFAGKRGSLPEHILFYRDGVSESQYGEVRQKELPQIRSACADAIKTREQSEPQPFITLVIVAKRHHARFYDSPAVRTNLLSGFIVDKQVVAPKQFNFYLQAHDSPIATALNAHYVVLENESNYTADELQQLTHKLSFTVSRATKGLSVCAPARYADFLCTRLRCYLRPALESDLGLGQNRDVNTYRQRATIWNAPSADTNFPTPRTGRTNPWEPKQNGFMFYL